MPSPSERIDPEILERARAIRDGRPIASHGQAATHHADRRELSARQLEVLALVADGLTNEEIGRRLFISKFTVDSHVKTSLRLLGVANRAHALATCFRLGLLT